MLEDSPLWEAIDLWGELTGVKAPEREGMSFSGTMTTWRLRDTYKELKEALELDPTEITATLMFKVFIKDWLRQASTSILDLIDDPTSHLEQLTKAKRLLAIVDRPEIVEARDQFIEQLRQGLAAYGAAERPDIQKLLTEYDSIAILRRDALRSIARLQVDQFLDGAPEADDVQPVYVPTIHQWWNINSLLARMTSTQSGVSLNLIREPNNYETYFAFALRNGASLFILTDVGDHPHPLAAQMYRKPGRDMAERIGKNWFPYDLLNVAIDSKDGAYFEMSEGTGIIPYQDEAVPTKRIGEVGPHETVWITMMLDLIVRKFWRAGYKAPQLSYTGEMIRTENVLLEYAQAANLPVAASTLSLPQLTLADIQTPAGAEGEDYDVAAYGRRPDRRNQWMEDRYGARVPEETLNLLEPPGKRLLLMQGSNELVPFTRALEEKRKSDHFFRRTDSSALNAVVMNPMAGTTFGSREKLERDRKFLARANYADQIDTLARIEFEARKDEIEKWFTARVKKNARRLGQLVGHGEVWLDATDGQTGHYTGKTGDERTVGSGHDKRDLRTFQKLFDITLPTKNMHYSDLAKTYAKISLGGWDHVKHSTCTFNEGSKASRVLMLYPTNPQDLAFLCDCKVEDLPDVLQHWNLRDGAYYGNSILDRVDPMLWKVRNPWQSLDLRVRIPLSLRAKAALEKAGTTPLPAHMRRVYQHKTKTEHGYDHYEYLDSPPAVLEGTP